MNNLFDFLKDRYIQLTKFLYLLVSKKRNTNIEYKHILFLRRDGIGDAVMFMPSFRAIKTKFSFSKIDLVNFKAFDEVLCAEKEVSVIKKPLLHLWRCALKRQRYDQIVIFSGGRELRILKCFEKYRNINIVTNTLRYSGEHCIDFYFRLSETIFGKLSGFNENPVLTITEQEKKTANNILRNNKLLNFKKIGIVVGSVIWWKAYPNWKGLINCIRSDTELNHYKICLFGGKNGAAEALRLRSKYQDIVDFTKLNLREAMAVACHFDLIICADSGFMHVASALGVKTLAVFGATAPLCMIKRSKRNRIWAVVLQLECMPCYIPGKAFSCKKNLQCMNIAPGCVAPVIKMVLKDMIEPESPLVLVKN